MSYWQLLSSSNDSRIEKPAEPEPVEPEPRRESENPPSEAAAESAQPAASESPAAAAEFSEEPFFILPDGSAVDSVTGYEQLCPLHIKDLRAKYAELSIPFKSGSPKSEILAEFFRAACGRKKLVRVCGVLDAFDDGLGGAITFASDSYALKSSSVYVPQLFIEKYGLKRGHAVCALAAAPREGERENCPFAVKITSVMGGAPEAARDIVPFSDLTPYYPTRRIILESAVHNSKDNLSMRAVDLLTPIGFGQRALIVAPPRTGKTVLMQGMAKSIRANNPGAKLIILLVDERPEEVTDFRRAIDAEVVASTFDQDAASHVHAAEMVISRARRMVETGEDVVILLDSITRLARAYNALMPNGGRTMSGGVEANALQKPKKFFGSARNIEGGGSLTIIGTALIETGSKMDEVIFEEFKGTGNLELDLDRSLSDKRIFPAINIEKSGTRKEELLYHPDELTKIYALRRAMKGIPAADSMEMLIQRLKKVKTNVEFLLGLNR
ncbi:MAG: transcription termination factor Rho [Verrucomicrobia bacterium]|nr:MAG: transcription termination factor Rho [Verrucomicrobiota bacterium]